MRIHRQSIVRHFCTILDNDLYGILGIASTSTARDVKLAYASLVKRYHPDVNQGDDCKFKDINMAYSILGHADKRREYDAYIDRKHRSRIYGRDDRYKSSVRL